MSDSDEDYTPADVDFRQSAAAFRAENAKVSKVGSDETPEQRAQREEEERVAAEVWADINKLRQGRATATRAPRVRQTRPGAGPVAAAAPTERQLEARRKRDEEAAKFRAQREAMAKQSTTTNNDFEVQIGTTGSPQKEVSAVTRQSAPEKEAAPDPTRIPSPTPLLPQTQTPSPADEPNDLDFLEDIEEDLVTATEAKAPVVEAPQAPTPKPAAAPTAQASTQTSTGDGIDWKARYEAERAASEKLSDLLKEYDVTMTQMVAGNEAPLLSDIERLKTEVGELEARAQTREAEHRAILKEFAEKSEAERRAVAEDHKRQLDQATGLAKAAEDSKIRLEAELEEAQVQIARLKQAETLLKQQHDHELQSQSARHQNELDALTAKHQAALDARPAATPVVDTVASTSADQNRHVMHEHRLLQLKCARLATVNTALEASKGALEAANKELMLICDELLLAASDANRG